MESQEEFTFDGGTYDKDRDGSRLSAQIRRVHAFMQDGQWHRLAEIADNCGGTEAGVSARLRDLRKMRFGNHTIEREYVSRGLWHYRLLA